MKQMKVVARLPRSALSRVGVYFLVTSNKEYNN